MMDHVHPVLHVLTRQEHHTPETLPGETAYVLYQLLPLASVRDLWWLEEMSTWFAGAMLFQVLM